MQPIEPIAEQLKWSLPALALPAEVQLRLFPEFVCIGDELVLDFDNWYHAYRDNVSGDGRMSNEVSLKS